LKKNEKNRFELFFFGHRLWIFLGFLFLFIGHELVRLLTLEGHEYYVFNDMNLSDQFVYRFGWAGEVMLAINKLIQREIKS
jgi:hypothetical protein